MAHVTVMEWQRVLMYVDGRLKRLLEPGRHRYRPRRTTLVPVDLRPRLLSVPGQELITADGVSVRVSVTAQWQIADAAVYTAAAASPEKFLYTSVQDAIRQRVSGLSLETALGDRGELSEGLTGRVQAEVSAFGIEVSEVRARDLMLPGELRRAAMDVVVARERGKAALEEARAEAAALRSLANTARLLEEHPALLRLRTLQVAAGRQTTLVLDPRAGADGNGA